VAIKLESPGPVFFRQIRLGKAGLPFACTKFRSMRVNAEALLADLAPLNEAQGPIFKMRDDPRLTRVGRILRRLSLDELPQLWNVVRGEMSLVGPRPPLPSEVEKYEDWHRHRLEVVPGITGMWQVSGRSELAFDEMVMLDLYYIENWSVGLDLQILARTIPTVLATRGAF
jgi:lipopolysaccharide/colanic/teichoic acid biosynthesis glycosyltransferase